MWKLNSADDWCAHPLPSVSDAPGAGLRGAHRQPGGWQSANPERSGACRALRIWPRKIIAGKQSPSRQFVFGDGENKMPGGERCEKRAGLRLNGCGEETGLKRELPAAVTANCAGCNACCRSLSRERAEPEADSSI